MGVSGSRVGAVQAMWRYPVKSMMGEEVRETEVSERGLAGDRAFALVDKASNRAAAVRTWGSRLMSYRAEYLEEPRADQPLATVRIRTPDGVELSTAQADIEARLSEGFDRSLSLMTQAPEGLTVECPPGTFGGKFAELTEGPMAGLSPAGTFFDAAPVHLIATSTVEHLQAAHPPGAVDVRRFRANLVVEGVGEPFAENAWVGRKLGVGDELVLQVAMTCPRCVNVTIAQDGLPREPTLLKTIAQGNLLDFGDYGRLPCAGVYATVLIPGRVRTGADVRLLD